MNKLLYFIVLMCLATSLSAQYIVPNHQIHKVDKGKMFLRWEPRDIAEWERSLEVGYNVEVYIQKPDGSRQMFRSQNLRPAPLNSWEENMTGLDSTMQEFYAGARNLIYISQEMRSEIASTILEGSTDVNREIDEFRLGFLAYACTYDAKLQRLAGLGYQMPVESNMKYFVKVYVNGYKPYEFDIDASKVTRPKVPTLTADFSDKEVELKWRTKEYKKDFYGYFLERSTDSRRFTRINELPFVNMLDTLKKATEYHSLKQKEKLEKNYKTYWFRVRGMDYFGDRSFHQSTVSGYGYDKIKMNPIVTFADQTDSNYALIRWKVEPIYNRLIEEFEIVRADTINGNYKPVLQNLPPDQREAQIKMKAKSNYFRIIMRPKDGEDISSFPVFVMGMDTVPPITPLAFTGKMDSNGIVTLQWERNTEDDLWGYKIFRSNFKSQEFGTITPNPLTDTFFVDTVNIKTFVEEIHYQIIAVDTRYNRSPFSEILTLEKPDIIPPVAPVIRRVTFMEDSIKVHWDNSGSHDVIGHKLFRKMPQKESSWSLIAEFEDTDSIYGVFYDKDFELENQYAYLLVALDDDGNESEPSRPYVTYAKSKKAKEAFGKIEVDVDKRRRKATISWTLKDPDAISEVKVYRGKSKDKISLWQILDPEKTSITQEKLSKNEKLYYYLSPSYKEGNRGKFSDLIVVEPGR
ncbi:MAG: hypothetical protein AAF990_22360 [Bacteroidota bacterium]